MIHSTSSIFILNIPWVTRQKLPNTTETTCHLRYINTKIKNLICLMEPIFARTKIIPRCYCPKNRLILNLSSRILHENITPPLHGLKIVANNIHWNVIPDFILRRGSPNHFWLCSFLSFKKTWGSVLRLCQEWTKPSGLSRLKLSCLKIQHRSKFVSFISRILRSCQSIFRILLREHWGTSHFFVDEVTIS